MTDGMVKLRPEELAAWRDVPTAVISDELACKGVMSPAIRSLTPGNRFAGQAVTVSTVRSSDDAPQRVLEALWPGAVIVIDGSAHPDTAVWGGNLIAGARKRSGAAVVVDGRVRDIVDLRASGLAIYARDCTPAGLNWGGRVNVPIRCGGVEVIPGALLVGDDDGIVVVPIEGREALLERCRQRIAADAAQQSRPLDDPATVSSEMRK